MIEDFKPFIESLKRNGFTYFKQYKKAEALVGETNTLAFINMYFLDKDRKSQLMQFNDEPKRSEFLDLLTSQCRAKTFLPAFDMAVKIMEEPHGFFSY